MEYRSYLRENYPDGDSRIENVEELVTAAETYMETAEDKLLPAFLEENDVQEQQQERKW